MSHFQPYAGLRVVMMTERGAECWARLAYNVPDNVGLGWKPYTILVQSYGATAYKAFHSVADLRRWLGGRFRVDMTGHGLGSVRDGWAVRTGVLVGVAS